MAEQQQRSQNQYTDNFTLYDSQFSSLACGFARSYNGVSGFVRIAPIFADQVGKTPQRGSRIYNYEGSQFYPISIQSASLLKRLINPFLKGKLREINIELTNERRMVICRSESFEEDIFSGETGIVLIFEHGGESMVHFFKRTEVSVGENADGKSQVLPIFEGFNEFVEFATNGIIESATRYLNPMERREKGRSAPAPSRQVVSRRRRSSSDEGEEPEPIEDALSAFETASSSDDSDDLFDSSLPDEDEEDENLK